MESACRVFLALAITCCACQPQCPHEHQDHRRINSLPTHLDLPAVLSAAFSSALFPALVQSTEQELPSVMRAMSSEGNVRVQSSPFGRQFKYYGSNSPLSDSFRMLVEHSDGESGWEQLDKGARALEIQWVALDRLLDAGDLSCSCR